MKDNIEKIKAFYYGFRFTEEDYALFSDEELSQLDVIDEQTVTSMWDQLCDADLAGFSSYIRAGLAKDLPVLINDCDWGKNEENARSILNEYFAKSDEDKLIILYSRTDALEASVSLFTSKWSDFCYPSDMLFIKCGELVLFYYEDKIFDITHDLRVRKELKIDKRVFNLDRSLPFVKDEDCKIDIRCETGEWWQFAYETNKPLQLDYRSHIMIIEEAGETVLLADKYLSGLESVRLCYPGLTDEIFPYVGAFSPTCEMRDLDGKKYVVTIGERKRIYRHRYDDFHDLVTEAEDHLISIIIDGADCPKYLTHMYCSRIISELYTMDRYRDMKCYEPYYPEVIIAEWDKDDELGKLLLKIAEMYKDLSYSDKENNGKMKYAVLSDIHGNWPAMNAVMHDAIRNGVDDYIFAGDYCLSGPYPDYCIATIRSTQNAIVVRGNEERYLENLIGKDQSTWTDGQMQISYWNFRNIKPDNLEYILSRPHSIDIENNGVNIHIAHQLDHHIDECEFRLFGPAILTERYKDVDVTPEYLKVDITGLFEKDEQFQKQVNELNDGIYIFGHSHVQWSYKVPGKNVWLVNPGSCGLPLDGIVNTVPYTIITISEDGEVSVEQKRIPFNMRKYSESIKQTTQYTEAPVWSKIIIKELTTAREHLTFFLRYVNKYAERIGDDVRPFSVDTWETAYEEWKELDQ